MNATYRLQLNPQFGFREIQDLIPYFRRLGISHLYLSPITEARRGSTNGYDVVDHNHINDELGGEAGYEALRQACTQANIHLVLDFVPNHAAVGWQNAFWQDVLAYGPHSPYARYFDIDWVPLKPELKDKLLLPFLGCVYGEAVDAGEIKIVYRDQHLFAAYWESLFAMSPMTYPEVLKALLPSLERTDSYWEVKDLHDSYAGVNASERERAEALRERFAALVDGGKMSLDRVLEQLQGPVLHELLEQQFWRLSYWKTAGYEVNYRRFFDINELVALRMEESEVFFNSHNLLGRLLRQEGITGVRVDHIDGLYDPLVYLKWVRELGARNIWVEKILASGETLPEDWPVEGTTGYEFMNDVVRLLNWPAGETPLDTVYRRIIQHDKAYSDVEHGSKRLVMETNLSGELFRLAYDLDRLSEDDYHTRDFTYEALREALAEVVAAFKRYRTYLPYYPETATDVIKLATNTAQRRNPAFEPSVYQFIQRMLLEKIREDLEPRRAAWVARFQQYTAPLAAKGVEDTAFYRYVRFLPLNEVGGEPDRFSCGPEVFSAHARFRALKYPKTLLATATHDHKRGEDTRMRLVVLSEIYELWRRTVRSLERSARRYRGTQGPSPNEAYIFYQVLAALWGSESIDQLEERLVSYMCKAAREAKVKTSWVNPNQEYEANLETFVRSMMHDRWVARAIGPVTRYLSFYGLNNSISQLLLKVTSPGIPDFYQGTELWDLSLVDPDNRRPVDYRLRQILLNEMEPLLDRPDITIFRQWLHAIDARLKLYITVRMLRFRKAHAAIFQGSYQPLEVQGSMAGHFFAYARQANDGVTAITVIPLFTSILQDLDEKKDALIVLPAAGQWQEILSGQQIIAGGHTISAEDLPLPWAVLFKPTD